MDSNIMMISVLTICIGVMGFILLVFFTERKFLPYSSKFFISLVIFSCLSFIFNDISYIFEYLKIAREHDIVIILASILCSYAVCISAAFYPDGVIYEREIKNGDSILKSGYMRKHYVFGIVFSSLVLVQITAILVLFINSALYDVVDYEFIAYSGYSVYYYSIIINTLVINIYLLFRLKHIGKRNGIFLLLFNSMFSVGSILDFVLNNDIYTDLFALIAIVIEFVHIQKLSMNSLRQGKARHELSIIENNAVIAGLADDYEGIIYVMLDNTGHDTVHENRISKAFDEIIPELKEHNSIYERLILIGNTIVVPQERDEYLCSIERETILENISRGSSYQVAFKTRINNEFHNYQLKFIASRDNEGKLIGFTVGLVNLDKRVTDQQTEKAYQHAILINAYCYYRVDFTADIVTGSVIEKVDGVLISHHESLTSYSSGVNSYAEKYLEGEDRKLFLQETTLAFYQKCYDEGNYTPEFTIRAKSFKRGYHYRRYVSYLSKDESNGHLLGMIVVYDVSDKYRIEEEIKYKARQESAFTRCINAMSKPEGEKDVLDRILEITADYYQADRACIFEINKSNNCFRLSYEWNPYGELKGEIPPVELSLRESENLKNNFKANDMVLQVVNDENSDTSDESMNFFKKMHIEHYVSAGIVFNNEIVGFIGVANPKYDQKSAYVLNSVSTLAYGEIIKKNQLSEESATLKVISKGFYSVYYIDFLKDYVHSYFTGDNKNNIADFASYSALRQYFLEQTIEREDIERCSLATSPDYIIKQLEKQSSYTLSYVSMSEGKKQNMTVEFIKANADGTCVVACLNDVTEILRSENEAKERLERAMVQAKSASNAKSVFMFNMSHDIRTPMNAITGFTHMAKKHIDDRDRVNDYLDKIDTSSQQLLSIINEVLEMSRIESGKAEVNIAPVHLPTELRNMVTVVSTQAEAKGLQFVSNIENITHEDVLADKTKLSQIMLNIIGNSIKYTPSGGKIKFLFEEIGSLSEDSTRCEYRLIIEDNGIGMSEEYLKTIYEPFSRENTSTISHIQGTGLGMSIVRELVNLLNGKIDISSTKGIGTKVVITAPFTIFDSVADDGCSTPAEVFMLKGKKVLLVEDNVLNREIARDIMEEYGLLVEEAEDGEAAVSKYVDSLYKGYSEAYDFILMDIQMPRMNGIEAARAIRELPLMNNRKRVPIIAMTANAFVEDRQLSLEAGMDAHIAKPIDIKLLVNTLIELMK